MGIVLPFESELNKGPDMFPALHLFSLDQTQQDVNPQLYLVNFPQDCSSSRKVSRSRSLSGGRKSRRIRDRRH